MSKRVPQSHRDLPADEARAYAYLVTIMPDGSPQVTPVWFDVEDDCIRISSARGRVKDVNMRSRPVAALLIADPRDPMRYIQVRGRILGISETGAMDHIGKLSRKYRGREWKPVPGQTRVIYRLAIDHVSAQ